MNKTTVIHHSADFDGLFCREIARKFIPDANLIGWDYGQPKIPTPEGDFYILDLSPECLSDWADSPKAHNRLIWIDHHKSALEKFSEQHQFGLGHRIDGVAACRLAWQWFSTKKYGSFNAGGAAWWVNLPTKEEYVQRTVKEPVAVRLAGEHDIWDHRDPDAALFQFGLRSQELTEQKWKWMLDGDAGPDQAIPKRYNSVVLGLLNDGKYVRYADQQAQQVAVQQFGFTVNFEGINFLAMNTAQKGSGQFDAGIKPEHEALLKFNWDGRQWDVSLYHAPGHNHHDLSTIAVKYGGGGHRGACGFRSTKLPFI
jgi:hypothetical protein